MRIVDEIQNIDYRETKEFFERRADKYTEKNPYSVTMYQDNNPELVQERNRREIEKLYPKLRLESTSRVLDIACGIGRWADAINQEIEEYCGIDFGRELIDIANRRNTRENFSFFEGTVYEIERILTDKHRGGYNRILMIGILMYVNDNDIQDFLKQVERLCEKNAVICIREPIGIGNRLTLKDFFSAELNDNYNAIYRTREELEEFIKRAFLMEGFRMVEKGYLFDEDSKLNNRKETTQYYYILER